MEGIGGMFQPFVRRKILYYNSTHYVSYGPRVKHPPNPLHPPAVSLDGRNRGWGLLIANIEARGELGLIRPMVIPLPIPLAPTPSPWRLRGWSFSRFLDPESVIS